MLPLLFVLTWDSCVCVCEVDTGSEVVYWRAGSTLTFRRAGAENPSENVVKPHKRRIHLKILLLLVHSLKRSTPKTAGVCVFWGVSGIRRDGVTRRPARSIQTPQRLVRQLETLSWLERMFGLRSSPALNPGHRPRWSTSRCAKIPAARTKPGCIFRRSNMATGGEESELRSSTPTGSSGKENLLLSESARIAHGGVRN